jgi:hypothetical protein
MTRRHFKVIALVAAMLAAGCNRGPAPEQSAGETAPAAPAAPAAPTGIAPATELVVNTVESVMVTRPQEAPQSVIIQASGTVPSSGWTEAKLVPLDEKDVSVRSFRFVATSPADGKLAGGTEAIEAQVEFEMMPADVATIRVVAGTNEVSAFLPPS